MGLPPPCEDYAIATSELASTKIIQQAASATLAQAN
jgi:flagellin-like hook-associated protein FlgL